MDKREKTMLGIGVLAALGIVLWSGSAKAKPKRDPFCPPGPGGVPMRWNAETQQCEPVNPSDPDFPDPVDPGDPRDPYCPPGPGGIPMRWSEEEGRCVPTVIPPDRPDPGNFDDIIKDFPTGGNFYQVRQGDIMGWGLGSGTHWNAVTYRLLSTELFLAAREYGQMSDEQALAFSKQHRGRSKFSNLLYESILCAAMNDYAYGTWGFDSKLSHAGGHGRAIRLLTQHADNELRLRQGLPMARTVSLRSPADKGKGNSNPVGSAQPGGNNSYPLLWLPMADRELLWSSKGQTLKIHSDFANPPPWVTDMGVSDYTGTTLTKWGCFPGQLDFG